MNITIDHIKDKLKDEISIIEVASALGILDKYNIKKTGNTYLGDCPTGHTSENHQCFGLNTEKNYYHCFHCNQAGDIISLVQLVQQTGYKQAILWLGKNFQPDLVSEIEHLSFERTKEEEESYRKHILYDETFQAGKRLLYEESGKLALQALLDRGYSQDNLKQTDWRLIGLRATSSSAQSLLPVYDICKLRSPSLIHQIAHRIFRLLVCPLQMWRFLVPVGCRLSMSHELLWVYRIGLLC